MLAPELERARGTADEGAACNGSGRGRAHGAGLGPKIPAQLAPREQPRGRPTIAYLQAWLGLAEGFPEERSASCEEKLLGLRFFPAAVATTHAASPSHWRTPVAVSAGTRRSPHRRMGIRLPRARRQQRLRFLSLRPAVTSPSSLHASWPALSEAAPFTPPQVAEGRRSRSCSQPPVCAAGMAS